MSGSNSGTGRKGRPREAASGHDFALSTLADTRQHTKELLQMLNATDNVARNAIFLPKGTRGEESIHGRAHAAVMAYADELTKPTYLIRANAQQFYTDDYATVEIPEELAETGEITVSVDDPRESFDIASYDFNTTEWPITLQNLGWWSMRFVMINKEVSSPYWNDGDHTERKKVVLPPRCIRETFRRLDSLAAELGVLLQIAENSPHDKS